MPPHGYGRRGRLRSDCWLVAVRTRTDKGCHSFTRRTNPPSSTTEECPPWLASFLSGKLFSLMPPVSSREVRERAPATVCGITSLRMHNSSILPHRKINRAVSRAYPLPKISSG